MEGTEFTGSRVSTISAQIDEPIDRIAGDFIDQQRIHIGHHARSVFSSKPISG